MKKQPIFSIVIPTLNEEDYLPSLLNNLSQQSLTNFEVIIADASSEDKTITKAKEYKNKLDIKILTTKTRNVSYQRNLGAKHAKADWIIFMDADNQLNRNFLLQIKNNINDNKTDIFTTLVQVDNKLLESWANFWLLLNFYSKKKSGYGAMIGVRTKLAIKYPFDQEQKVMEDTIFIQQIVDKNYSYNIFSNPKYILSARRQKSSSIYQTITTTVKITFHYYILSKDFKKTNFNYELKGGNSYK